MGGLANSVRPRSPRADDNQREGPRPSTHGIFSTSRLPHATRPPGRADGNCRRTITGGAEPPGPRNAARGQRCGASPAARRQVGHGAGLPAALYTPPGCQGRHSRTSKPTSGTWATWQACTRDQRAAVPNPASSRPCATAGPRSRQVTPAGSALPQTSRVRCFQGFAARPQPRMRINSGRWHWQRDVRRRLVPA